MSSGYRIDRAHRSDLWDWQEDEGPIEVSLDIGSSHVVGVPATVVWERVVRYYVFFGATPQHEQIALHLQDLTSLQMPGELSFFPRAQQQPLELIAVEVEEHRPIAHHVDRLFAQVKELPSQAARSLARSILRHEAVERSPWADRIGPLYSATAVAEELDISEAAVVSSIDAGCLLAIESDEGELLLPVAQLGEDGQPLRGLKWLTSQLPTWVLDRYMLCTWMNTSFPELDGNSPWQDMRSSGRVSDELRAMVDSLRRRMRQ